MSDYRPLESTLTGNGPVESDTDVRTVDWWGVVFLIVVLSAFFSAIMFSWFYLRSGEDPWPPTGTSEPDALLPSVATGALLLSCLPLLLLQRRLTAGSRSGINLLLGVSAGLGLAFVATQVVSFLDLDFGARDHAYGSAFFTITVFVMLLVVGGLYVGAIVQARAWKGHFNGARYVAVTNLATYWYSVTVMWVIVYLSIYLLALVD